MFRRQSWCSVDARVATDPQLDIPEIFQFILSFNLPKGSFPNRFQTCIGSPATKISFNKLVLSCATL